MPRSALGTDAFPTLGDIDSSKWVYLRDTAWTTTPPQVVTGNFLVGSAQGETVFNLVRWIESGDVFGADHYVEFTIGGLGWAGGGHFVGPAVRVSGDTNTAADAYYLKIRDDAASGADHEWQLIKLINGTETAIDTRRRTTTNGDTVALEAVGTSLLVYQNGSLAYTITGQTDLTTGHAGLILSGNGGVGNVSVDLSEVGNITSGTTQDLAGAATGQGTAAGALDHGVPIAGAATGQGSAAGTVDHGVPLAGAAAGQGSAAGALEVVTLPVAWLNPRRKRPGSGPYSTGRFYVKRRHAYHDVVASLGGNAAVQATAAAALQLLVNLAGAGTGQATASGVLAGNAVQLAGAAAGVAGASGQLAVSVLLNGGALGVGTASGSLSTNGSVDLAGAATGLATASGGLQLTVQLAGAALGTSNASGTLQGTVPLSGAAVALATASGQLALSIALSGAALAEASAAATFAGVVVLGGAAAVQAGATGSLFLNVPLAGAAQGLAAAGGGLVLTILLGGGAQGQAGASGGLQQAVLLTGGAGGQASAMGALTLAGISVSTERAFRCRQVPRRWRVCAPPTPPIA